MFDFPDQPVAGDTFIPVPGAVYTYNGISWEYKLFANSQPTVHTIYPDEARIGSPDLIVRVEGGGFTNTTEVLFGGSPTPTRLVSQSIVSFNVDPTGPAPRDVPVTVRDGQIPGIGSADFRLLAPLPMVIDSIDPQYVVCSSPDVTLNVMGNVFHGNCFLKINGVAVPTTYRGFNTLSTPLTPSAEPVPRTVQVTANDTINDSNPITLNYILQPTLTSVAPSSINVSVGPTVVTYTGTNFTPQATVRFGNTVYPTTYVSPTELTVTITATSPGSLSTHVGIGDVVTNQQTINAYP